MIAGVVFLLCLLVLVAPGYLARQRNKSIALQHLAIWLGIGAVVALAYDIWKG